VSAAAAPGPIQSNSAQNKKNSVPESGAPESEESRWQPFLCLPCRLTVELAVPRFKVRDFLALGAGSVIGTDWGLTRDVPLRVNGTLVGWAELEGASQQLAVRVTELA
jgi:flagellar motor switch/type III secretory pathway protein FliN